MSLFALESWSKRSTSDEPIAATLLQLFRDSSFWRL